MLWVCVLHLAVGATLSCIMASSQDVSHQMTSISLPWEVAAPDFSRPAGDSRLEEGSRRYWPEWPAAPAWPGPQHPERTLFGLVPGVCPFLLGAFGLRKDGATSSFPMSSRTNLKTAYSEGFLAF